MIKIDLHGIKHEDASRILEKNINYFWGDGEEMEIVTGHSKEMKKIVIDTLQLYGLEYTIGDFSEINTGYIKTVLD